MQHLLQKKRETSYNYYHLNIKELGLLESKNKIDCTKVETYDKFRQKYMNEPEPEEENPPKKVNEPKFLFHISELIRLLLQKP